MKEKLQVIRKYVPSVSLILFTLVPIAALIHLSGALFPRFADFFNIHISSFFRAVLAYLTNLLPFSLSESIIIFLPFAVVIMFIVIIPKTKYDIVGSWRYVSALASVIAYIYVIFVFTFALGYQGTSVTDKLGMTQRDVSAEELYITATKLSTIVNDAADNIDFAIDGSSVIPYSHEELVDKLNAAYNSLSEKYEFVPKLYSNCKRIALSEPMTYTHISGVYTFFTGEANININFPDYTVAYTAAHEMSHQRGIAPEDEANFMAFLVCMESDDAYIRYSGAVNLFEYVCSALYKADRELYSKMYRGIDNNVKAEFAAYNAFFEKYEENVAANVTGSVNNAYLQIQGTEGTRSYGLVADLAVVYFCDGHYIGD